MEDIPLNTDDTIAVVFVLNDKSNTRVRIKIGSDKCFGESLLIETDGRMNIEPKAANMIVLSAKEN
jgi:hypothetical protein